MAGITRFEITDVSDGRGAKRFSDAKSYWDIANSLYQYIFSAIGMPLAPGNDIVKCTKAEFEAGYDYQLGIDVVLQPIGMGVCTMQEKFLFTDFNTVTIGHCQDWMSLEPGDWYKLKAQYYFVGYDYQQKNRQLKPWILLDWAKLQRATAQRHILWNLRSNDPKKVGAKASLMFVKFNELPEDVIVTSSLKLQSSYLNRG